MRVQENYYSSLEEIWEVKERIYNETKDMSYDEFVEYKNQSIADVKVRFTDKIFNLNVTDTKLLNPVITTPED